MVNPILAAILSFFIPGLGQFYAGSLQKGIVMFLLAAIIAILVSIVFREWVYYLVNLLYSIYVAYDAYMMAQE